MQTCQAVNLSAGVAPNPLGTMGRSAAIALTEKILMVSPSLGDLNLCHRLGSTIFPFIVVPLRVARAGRRGFSDPRSFLPFSLSAACLKFFAFRFRAAPPGDDPTLIDA